MNRDYNDLCIVCNKSIIHKDYSNFFCGYFCSHLHYYRQRFGVCPQPKNPFFFKSTSILEMRSREMAAHDEYKVMKQTSNLSEP